MVGTGGERGLLGLAFHPSFESNRKVFAYFTDGGGDIQIAEFTANDDGGAAGADTYLPILTLEHSANSNHNGGQLMFGPDGALYAFVGDGGGSLDENGQSDATFLGKMLRLVPNLSGGLASAGCGLGQGPSKPMACQLRSREWRPVDRRRRAGRAGKRSTVCPATRPG